MTRFRSSARSHLNQNLQSTIGWLLLLSFALLPSNSFAQKEKYPPTTRTELAATWEVSGTVSSETGRPLAAVDVYLYSAGYYQPAARSFFRTRRSLSTSRLGNYKIEVVENGTMLFVSDGFAPVASKVPKGSGLDIKLPIGRTVSGTILLPSGEPAKRATITPVQWLKPRIKKLEFGRSDGENPDNAYAKMEYLAMPDFGSDRAVQTSDDGWFEIKNLPEEYRVGLSIKSPGTKEKVVYVRPDSDARGKDFKNQILEDNEFLYELEPSSSINLTATEADTGKPTAIGQLHIQPIYKDPSMARMAHQLRFSQEFKESTIKSSIKAYPSGARILVEPVDTKNLLGVTFEIPPNGELETIEKEIQFPRGKLVRGTVKSAETGKPISNVKLRWRSATEFLEWDKENFFPALEIRTNDNGEFAVVVPEADGILGVIGEVPGHRSVAQWSPLDATNVGTEIRKEFTRDLLVGDLDDEPELLFELKPSSTVEVKVVDAEGHPVSNCVVSGNRTTLSDTSQSSSNSVFNIMTKQQGTVTIEHWYQDAYQLGLARETPKQTEGRRFSFDARNYPTTLQAFTDDGFRQGVAKIPLPAIDAETNTIPVTITLLPGGSVVGQVITPEGKPIVDLEIVAAMRASSFWGAGQTWKTKTRRDGKFKMEGLPANGKFVWNLDPTRVKTKKSSGSVEFDTSQMQNGGTIEIEPVMCIDFSGLLAELPDLNMKGLSKEKALETLVEYFEACNSRVPPKYAKFNYQDEEYMRFFSSQSGGDPIPTYRNRVMKKALPFIKELANRNAKTEFEFKLIEYSHGLFSDPMFGSNFSEFAREQLFKNHMNNPNAQKLLVGLTESSFSYPRETHWLALYEANEFKETKFLAAYHVCHGYLIKALQNCDGQTDEEVFERSYKNLKKFLQAIKDIKVEGKEADKVRAKWNSALRMQADSSFRSIRQFGNSVILTEDNPAKPGATKALERTNAIQKQRMEKLMDLVNRFVPPMTSIRRQ